MSVVDEPDLRGHVMRKLVAAKDAARVLAEAPTAAKNEALSQMAEVLWEHRTKILLANEADVTVLRANGQGESRADRLMLNEHRLMQMIDGLLQIVELADPIGETLETMVRPNGLRIEKVRVPMGLIAMIYESRPNVTVDATGLCMKTGNAVVLRGGRESLQSNMAIVEALREGVEASGLPGDAIGLIERVEHETVDLLIGARGLVDLVIPRGGAGLIGRVVENAKVPVIETGVGNCHVFVDESADIQKATDIIVNAKTQRPSVCNAVETLLVHEGIAEQWLPHAAPALGRLGVELRVCQSTGHLLRQTGYHQFKSATEEDFATEFLGPILSVKVVASLDEAIDHIRRYGTRHSEVIVTENAEAAQTFLSQVDAAVVYHNASSRFTDGFEFGFGAEIGISTQKLHARGPMGLRAMTSYKYVVHGDGQIRL